MKKRFIAAGTFALFAGLFTWMEVSNSGEIGACNAGKLESCVALARTYGPDFGDAHRIKNPAYQETLENMTKAEAEKEAKAEADRKEREAKRVEYVKAREAQRQWENKLTLCQMLVERSLKDPDSFRRLSKWPEFKQTGILRYSATNSFGGRVQESYDCR